MINGRYERGFKQHALIEQNYVPKKLDLDVIYQILGITALVRIPLGEFPFHASPGQTYTHFGLPVYDAQVGQRVLLTPIIKTGEFKTGIDIPPVLSLNRAMQAKVTEYHPKLSYEELNPAWLRGRTIGNIDNLASLQSRMIARYQPVLSLSPTEILELGVSMRKLKITRVLTEQEKQQLW